MKSDLVKIEHSLIIEQSNVVLRNY